MISIRNKDELNENENQLLINSKTDIMVYHNKFKNVKKFGKVNYKLNNKLSEVIYNWCIKMKTEYPDFNYLFFNQSRRGGFKKHTSTSFSRLIESSFKEHIEQKLGMNIIRHIKATYIENTYSRLCDRQREHLKMFHTLNMGLLYNKL